MCGSLRRALRYDQRRYFRPLEYRTANRGCTDFAPLLDLRQACELRVWAAALIAADPSSSRQEAFARQCTEVCMQSP